MPSILVIGMGNEYRGDDGVGPIVASALSNRHVPGVRSMQDPGDMLTLIDQWHAADTVILIDALASGAAPGTIYCFDALAQPIPTNVSLSSTHSFDLAQAVRIAQVVQRLPSRLLVYTIAGKQFDMGIHLSPQVEDVIDEVIEQVEHECMRIIGSLTEEPV